MLSYVKSRLSGYKLFVLFAVALLPLCIYGQTEIKKLSLNEAVEIGFKKNPEVKSDNEEILPNVHRVASLLKRWLLGTHQKYLVGNNTQHYLDEFTFRYNRRKSLSRGLLFQRVMEQAVKHEPIKYFEINTSYARKEKKLSGKN